MSKSGPHSKVSAARSLALKVNRTVRERNAFTQEIIASLVDTSSLSVEDRAFATKICLGITASLGTLDELIDTYVRDPRKLDPEVRDVLRIGTYEIIFLDKSPHAAVDQSVELAKTVNPKTSGLVNAVLRKVVQAKEEFPFGDPAHDAAALARSQGFPLWIAQRLIDDLGFDSAAAFMKASNEPAPVFIAANFIKVRSEEVNEVFSEAGSPLKQIQMGETPFKGCWRLENPRVLQNPEVSKLFTSGKILVSDLASQVIARLILPQQQPRSFLEIGAGRGTKTILLQSNALATYGHQMDITVCDNHQFKMDIHSKRMDQFGVKIARSIVGDATKLSSESGLSKASFDNIFIDAPCSGLGTLRRHPEIRWRLTPEGVSNLASVQLSLLEASAPLVSAGGVLSYATCTVLKEENTEVVKKFLRGEAGKDFALKKLAGKEFFASSLTPGSADAHFAVSMVRKH